MSGQSWMPLRSFSPKDAVLYRYDDRREGGLYFDGDGDCCSTGYETTKVVLSVFDIVKKKRQKGFGCRLAILSLGSDGSAIHQQSDTHIQQKKKLG